MYNCKNDLRQSTYTLPPSKYNADPNTIVYNRTLFALIAYFYAFTVPTLCLNKYKAKSRKLLGWFKINTFSICSVIQNLFKMYKY